MMPPCMKTPLLTCDDALAFAGSIGSVCRAPLGVLRLCELSTNRFRSGRSSGEMDPMVIK